MSNNEILYSNGITNRSGFDRVSLYLRLYEDLVCLASVVGIDEIALQKYFIPEGNDSSRGILLRLCSSLQNRSMVRNTIRFNDEAYQNREIIEGVLFGFDLTKTNRHYKKWEEIYNAIVKSGIIDNGDRKNTETNWDKYCRGLFDGIEFLEKENGKEIIRSLVKSNSVSDQAVEEIKRISTRIHGLGFSLTCDWLKECGCLWLAKPDVHIAAVIRHLERNEKLKETDIVKIVCEWAEEVKKSTVDNNVSAYKIDKIIWLLCTGYFYLDGYSVGREAVLRRIDAMW